MLIKDRDDNKRSSTITEIESLPMIYDELLSYYVEVLSKSEFYPYQSYIKLILKSFNPLFQLRFWRSPHIRYFFKVPNTLKQDLMGASDILAKVRTLRANTLEAVIMMNELNLKKLQRRSALSWFNKLAIGISGLLGLLTAMEKITSLNIADAISSCANQLVGPLVGLFIGGAINIILSLPMIGLVRAFGDILKIAKAYRTKEGNADTESSNNKIQPTAESGG